MYAVVSNVQGRNLCVSSVSALRRLCNTMSEQQYRARRAVNDKTLFDYMGSSVDVNLKMGTPGENLLSKCKELMKNASLHRLVGLHIFNLNGNTSKCLQSCIEFTGRVESLIILFTVALCSPF